MLEVQHVAHHCQDYLSMATGAHAENVLKFGHVVF